jgi:hypothetical protein
MKAPNDVFSIELPRLFALAAKLEGEGQYNNAKLIRATADALSRKLAYHIEMPDNKQGLAKELSEAADLVTRAGLGDDLATAIQRGVQALEEGKLPLIHETPNPYICRTCGTLSLETPEVGCPVCGARPATYQRFLPVYWLDNFNPQQALRSLRQTPEDLGALLTGLSEEKMNAAPANGGWTIRNAVAHIRDAQGVLEVRINQLIDHHKPKLDSKAVFEWATEENEHEEATAVIYNTYFWSRQRVLQILEGLPLVDWQRIGEHEEFGLVTIQQQASYFATHELTHFPQIVELL